MAAVTQYGVGSGPWPLARGAIPVGSNMLDRHPELAADGAGGAMVVWTDATRGRQSLARDLDDVLAQRMSPTGTPVWSPAIGAGHVIAAGAGEQYEPHLIEDGLGGGFFTWNSPGWGGLPAEGGLLLHLDGLGRPAPGWATAGIRVGTEISGLYSDLAGGAWVSYFDGQETMLRRFPRGWSPGSPLPVALSLGAQPREALRLCPDLEDGAFLAWQERDASQVIVRIEHVTGVGTPMVATSVPRSSAAPLAFMVYPIRPNPARAACRIEFDLPARSPVEIQVFDVAGRRVGRPADGTELDAGPQSVGWDLRDRDGRPLPAGLYLVRVAAGEGRAVVRLVVTRAP
jgi:flagellar hook capping protein FlgD